MHTGRGYSVNVVDFSYCCYVNDAILGILGRTRESCFLVA
jgi:hypothetical protein